MRHYSVWVRSRQEVLTDPQRRVYNGVPFSSETVWTEWSRVCTYSNKFDAEDSAAIFRRINPSRQYKVLERGAAP
jgi:hypothetical protein